MTKALIDKTRVQKNRFFVSALFIKRRSCSVAVHACSVAVHACSVAVHEVCIIILSNQKLNHLTLKIEELDLTLICWLLINFLYVLDR